MLTPKQYVLHTSLQQGAIAHVTAMLGTWFNATLTATPNQQPKHGYTLVATGTPTRHQVANARQWVAGYYSCYCKIVGWPTINS